MSHYRRLEREILLLVLKKQTTMSELCVWVTWQEIVVASRLWVLPPDHSQQENRVLSPATARR